MLSGGQDANRTVTVSSANPTSAQASTAWNSSATVKGNVALYNSYVRYFTAMAKGALNGPGPLAPDYYNSTSATAARKLSPPSYQWPKARARSDTWVDFLSNIKAPATINIAMFQWTSHGQPGDRNYLELPKKLVSLAQTGVKIHILITAGMVDDSVQSYLRNRPNIDVHDTTRGTDANGNALHYTHDKYMMVSGNYAGAADSRLVFVGSSNWTSNGVWHNDESDLKLVGAVQLRLVHGGLAEPVRPLLRDRGAAVERRGARREYGAGDSDRSEAGPGIGILVLTVTVSGGPG